MLQDSDVLPFLELLALKADEAHKPTRLGKVSGVPPEAGQESTDTYSPGAGHLSTSPRLPAGRQAACRCNTLIINYIAFTNLAKPLVTSQ